MDSGERSQPPSTACDPGMRDAEAPLAPALSSRHVRAQEDSAALPTAPLPYAPRQFDRSQSYSNLSSSTIELSSFGDGGGSSSSDDGEGGSEGAGRRSGRRRGGSQQGLEAASNWAAAPFEVAEPSTETAFVMRTLREELSRKTNECEHLRQIIKELSESRARVQRNKVDLEEAHLVLQKEYMRVIKVSELARTVSAQHLTRSHTMGRELQAAKDAASRATRRGAAAADKARRLKAQNMELRRRLEVMEALAARSGALEFTGTSACARELLASARAPLY